MKIPATLRILAAVVLFMTAYILGIGDADAIQDPNADRAKNVFLELQRSITNLRNANLQLCKAGNQSGCALAKVNEMQLIQAELEWSYEYGSSARPESDDSEEVCIALDDLSRSLDTLSAAIEFAESDDEW